MTGLAAIGLGYCARHLVTTRPQLFESVFGTARRAESLCDFPAGVAGAVFDGETLSPEAAAAITTCARAIPAGGGG